MLGESESDAQTPAGTRVRALDDSHDNVNLDSFDGIPARRNRPSDDIWKDLLVPGSDGEYMLASKESSEMSRLSDPEAIRLKKLKSNINTEAERIEENKSDPRRSEERMNKEERT